MVNGISLIIDYINHKEKFGEIHYSKYKYRSKFSVGMNHASCLCPQTKAPTITVCSLAEPGAKVDLFPAVSRELRQVRHF